MSERDNWDIGVLQERCLGIVNSNGNLKSVFEIGGVNREQRLIIVDAEDFEKGSFPVLVAEVIEVHYCTGGNMCEVKYTEIGRLTQDHKFLKGKGNKKGNMAFGVGERVIIGCL